MSYRTDDDGHTCLARAGDSLTHSQSPNPPHSMARPSQKHQSNPSPTRTPQPALVIPGFIHVCMQCLYVRTDIPATSRPITAQIAARKTAGPWSLVSVRRRRDCGGCRMHSACAVYYLLQVHDVFTLRRSSPVFPSPCAPHQTLFQLPPHLPRAARMSWRW